MFNTLKKIIAWTGSRKKRFYAGFVLSFFQHMFISMPIFIGAYLIDLMIKDSRGELTLNGSYVVYSLIAVVFCVFMRFLLGYLKAVLQESIAYEKTADERIKIGSTLKKVSMGFYQQNKTGEISAAVTTDLSILEMYSMKMADTFVSGYISAFVMILFLVFYSWQAAAIAVGGLILSGLTLHMINVKSRENQPVHQKAQDSLIGAILEHIRGIAVIKSYGQEGKAVESVRNACGSHRKINVKIELDYVIWNIMHRFALSIAGAGIVLAAAILMLNGSMEMGAFLALTIFSFVLFGGVETINNSAHTMEMMESAFKKIDGICNAKLPSDDGTSAALKDFNIAFSDVSFAYDTKTVIDKVSFSVPQGKTTAIVGPSGCGKTTLCYLMARFYDINGGSIRIGGTDIRKINCDNLLKNFSMVFQNVYLFNDTILNNIKFGKPNASLDEVISAAKKACCHDFIMSLPNGYDTVVGECGSSLSGGEKQRISIARAIIKNAPIIILDEATASVDPENEHLIQNAITELARGKTMIVIAHRLATIENAEQILVMDNGKIIQSGTHGELIRKNGLYKTFIGIRKNAESWNV